MTMQKFTRRILLCLVLGLIGTASVFAQTSDEKREQQLKVPEILEAMGISEGSQIADVGAGSGFFTGRIAKKVGPAGRVYAVDIDEKNAIPRLQDLVKKESLTNVDVIHSEPGDPKLPEGKLDAVLMVIAYHEIQPYQEMLSHVKAALKPGGRFVIVEMMPRKTRLRPRGDQTKNHVIAPEIAEAEFRAAGFEIVSRKDDFMDRPNEEETRWMIICQRPE
jgi:ubiquinone/menaquinone biosynthesis C-methylase UbiE